MFCQYQKHNLDNKENQILLAALRQCQKEIRSNVNLVNGTPLQEWARMSDNALSGVTLRRVHPAEFQSLQLGGLKKAYKKPLRLARWILILFGSDPNQPPQAEHQKTEIPPFAINMNELFERFCEVKLRDSKEFDKIWAGYQDNNLGEFDIRPDFIAECKNSCENVVLDAKYKYGWKENIRNNRYDVYQIVTYCRHCGTKSSDNESCPKKAVIMSPAANNVQGNLSQSTKLGNKIWVNDFKDPEIYHWQIKLP
jgi:5-methylcytosine-specific restriction endonuclease McrBC regulatory subunit McrC